MFEGTGQESALGKVTSKADDRPREAGNREGRSSLLLRLVVRLFHWRDSGALRSHCFALQDRRLKCGRLD